MTLIGSNKRLKTNTDSRLMLALSPPFRYGMAMEKPGTTTPVEQGPKWSRRLRKCAAFTLALVSCGIPGSKEPFLPPDRAADFDVVTMGDSISAGSGIQPHEPGTEQGCQRSLNGSLADELRQRGVTNITEVGCRGASVDDMYREQHHQPPQIDAVTEKTDTVILSLGINFLDLKEVFAACKTDECTPDAAIVVDTFHQLHDEGYRAKLVQLYRDILDRMHPRGILYLTEYSTPIRSYCPVVVGKYTAIFIETLVDEVNTVMHETAAEVGGKRIVIVPAQPWSDVCITLGTGVQLGGSNVGHPTSYEEQGRRVAERLVTQTAPYNHPILGNSRMFTGRKK